MRKCGECTLCCKLLLVSVYDSPMYEYCKHCTAGGCGIYETRDNVCREFKCGWLRGELTEEDRPDKSGFIVEHLDGVPVVLVLVDEGQDNKVYQETEKLKTQYVENGIAVVLKRSVLLPDTMTSDEATNYIIEAAESIVIE